MSQMISVRCRLSFDYSDKSELDIFFIFISLVDVKNEMEGRRITLIEGWKKIKQISCRCLREIEANIRRSSRYCQSPQTIFRCQSKRISNKYSYSASSSTPGFPATTPNSEDSFSPRYRWRIKLWTLWYRATMCFQLRSPRKLRRSTSREIKR